MRLTICDIHWFIHIDPIISQDYYRKSRMWHKGRGREGEIVMGCSWKDIVDEIIQLHQIWGKSLKRTWFFKIRWHLTLLLLHLICELQPSRSSQKQTAPLQPWSNKVKVWRHGGWEMIRFGLYPEVSVLEQVRIPGWSFPLFVISNGVE